MLWVLMLSFPFPYIATTTGWMTAELGRQPWLIYGLMRTSEGTSSHVSAGNTLFTLIGFMGMYTVLSVLFLFLVYREIEHGPRGSEGVRWKQSSPYDGVLKIRRKQPMETLWFCLVAIMIAMYVVFDGFDLGVGILHL